MIDVDAAAGRVDPLCRSGTDGSSASSSNSKTRSADAIVSWMVFAMLLNCVIGIENWRLYWMNACTSPSAIARRVTR